jgi:predicted RNA-binding Zn ribbon-like protein
MPVSTPETHHPPHELDLVIDFVNTLDAETGIDQLASTGGLADWLAEKQLLEPVGTPIGEPHRQQALGLREALRAVLLAHTDGGEDTQAAAELDRAAERGRLAVRFGADGSSRLEARADGVSGALARLLIPVVESGADGSWRRMKACRADDCRWAFYDNSRNRSGVWCNMAVCGNRTKVRAYRQRNA